MNILLQLIAITVCLLMCYGLIAKTKKKELSESQAFMWLVGTLGLLFLSFFPGVITWAADLLGVWWAPATLIFFLIVVIILILFHHTISVTALESKVTELAMHMILLEEKNKELENRSALSEKEGESQE